MARITLYMRNTKEVDFETAVFKPVIKDGKIVSAEYFRKDNGMSLMYVDWSEVIAVTRDSRKDTDE